ncbi:polyprenyl synthetase family protein [Dysgonomonas sp. 511]|nr:polyprenyl synthetase family protein [Dysgonomonas sp. 511]NDV79024.1 polyprenyl synthetase family protein [Dysgonomonas sp. 511]
MKSIYSFNEILEIVNENIGEIKFDHKPESLYEPISYILSLGGKRVRPALVLMAYNLYAGNLEKAIPTALGIETFHNFTLLHDDLMDNADIRRGKPTVHIKWDDNTAVLSGDAMLIEAYKLIGKTDAKYFSRIFDLFSDTTTEIVCGQQFDMEFEKRMDVTVDEYIEMIRLKTAVLLACALKCGAIIADASEQDADNLYEFGINIGLGFQLKDDLLDVYGDSKTFGKRIGGDILCDKKTYLLISALRDNSAKEELAAWIGKEEFDEEEKIKAVTAIYDKLGLKQQSEQLIKEYYLKAVACLDKVEVDKQVKAELYKLAEDLTLRTT